ncbi:hypothetical protein FQA39_LY04385 [Lamprigera yunnana]|nr:hypothetical protein FQA39_LY04385 [Lamprigera yunnana]
MKRSITASISKELHKSYCFVKYLQAKNIMESSTHEFTLKKIEFENLDPITQESLKKAAKVRDHAYAPYSNFKVGASVVTEDDSIFVGCNVENSTFVAICAERVAYVKAVSEGHRKFKSVAVIAFQEENITAPCGTCRQFIAEFGNVDIYISKPKLKDIYKCNLSDLLPLQFRL